MGASSDFESAVAFGTNKLVFNGTGNTVTVTGLSEHKKYYFKAYTYKDTGLSAGTPVIMDTAEVHGVSHLTTLTGTQQVKLQWQNYPGPQGIFWDEVLIIAAAGSSVTTLPSGDASAYIANSEFGKGTAITSGNFVVYKGVGDTVTVTGLTNGTTYAFRVFVHSTSSWTSEWRSLGITAKPSDGPSIPDVPQIIAPVEWFFSHEKDVVGEVMPHVRQHKLPASVIPVMVREVDFYDKRRDAASAETFLLDNARK